MSSHGRTGFVRWWLGSVADEVLHHTDGPLLISGPGVATSVTGETKLEKAIVPLDGSALAEAVLPHAAAVAEALGMEIDLVKVTPSEGLLYFEGGQDNGEDGRGQTETTEELDARAAHYLDEVAEGLRHLGAPSVKNHVVHGAPPSDALAAPAKDFEHALMAVATHGRAGLARGLMGSVAGDLIRLPPHPVLVLRVADHKVSDQARQSRASHA